MKKQVVGIIILLVIIGAAIAYQQFFAGGKAVELKGFIGGEKALLLEDLKVQEILKKKYHIVLDYTKMGSIEMVQETPVQDLDFLWPSSQVALELFKQQPHAGQLVKSEIIFNSPIVLYSWDIVTDKLIELGIVELIENTYYVVDFPRLVQLVVDGTKWADMGLPELYGRVLITSTDPTKSNSGNMFSGLLANILAGQGEVVNMQTLPTVLPTVKSVFTSLGFMEQSSSTLFEAYLTKGRGDKPLIVGYESQIVEFSLQYRDMWPSVKNNVRILYPRPTVWSSHPLLVLKNRAEPLLEALKDPEIQRIAWEQHGFRSGLPGIQNDPKVLEIAGIPATITNVMPMPDPQVMEAIIAALSAP